MIINQAAHCEIIMTGVLNSKSVVYSIKILPLLQDNGFITNLMILYFGWLVCTALVTYVR